MVSKAAGVDRLGYERVAERVHLHQWGHPHGVAEVVAVLALGEAGAGGRLDAADRRTHPPGQRLAQERECQTAEVGAATRAADEQVGHLVDLGELEQRLLADDRLVQQHVVQHAAERVAGVGVGDGHGDGLGDGDAEAARVVGVLGQQRAAVLRERRRTGVHRRAPHLHHRAPIRLLAIRRGDLPDLTRHLVLGGSERERAAPLPGARFRRQLPDAVEMVVVRLRHRGVGLVRARRADTFVLVEDLRRGVEQGLEPTGAVQRARAPQLVHVDDLTGDVDVPLRRHLLLDQRHREQRREVVGAGGLQRPGVQRRRRRARQIGDHVVPGRRHLVLREQHLVVITRAHGAILAGHVAGVASFPSPATGPEPTG